MKGTVTTATVCCVSTAGCCAPPAVICRRARAYGKLNFGQREELFKFKSDISYVSKVINFTTYNIFPQYAYSPLMDTLWSIQLNVWWEYYSVQISMRYIREDWLNNREESEGFKSAFDILSATDWRKKIYHYNLYNLSLL